MGKFKRLLALILSVILLLTASGCTLADNALLFISETVRGGTSFYSMEYERPDAEIMHSIAEEIYELLDSGAGYSEVVSALDRFYTEYQHFNTLYTLASIRSDLDTGDSYYAEEYEYCAELDADISALFTELMVYCADSAMADELDRRYFGGMLAESYSDGFDDGFERLNALYARESSLLTRYRELLIEFYAYEGDDAFDVYNGDMCGIYIELVKLRHEIASECGYESYEELAYSDFGRDYSPEDTEALIAAVKEQLVPLYREAREKGIIDDAFLALEENNPADSLKTVCKTVSKMSSVMKKAAGFMRRNYLYDVSYYEDKLDTAYTVYIDDYNAPYMFIDTYGYEEDILTIAHEFGHYTDAYCNYGGTGNLDTSEALSQGLEYLLLCYLDDSELASRLTDYKLTDTLSLLVTQTCFNDFERRVFALPEEELTASRVNSLYAECANEYGIDTELENAELAWIDISHFFDYPFYVISYCSSCVAAFNIYRMELDCSGAGLSAYLKVMRDTDYSDFLELTQSAGIPSPLSADSVSDVAEVIKETLGL